MSTNTSIPIGTAVVYFPYGQQHPNSACLGVLMRHGNSRDYAGIQYLGGAGFALLHLPTQRGNLRPATRADFESHRVSPEGHTILPEQVNYVVEYTDTFGGEANYGWVRHYEFTAPENASDRTLMRKAKALAGLTGQRGKRDFLGETLEFRPRGCATVLFITPIL